MESDRTKTEPSKLRFEIPTISPERLAATERNRAGELERERRRQEQEDVLRRRRYWLASGVPLRYQNASLDDLSRVPADAIQAYRAVVDAMSKLLIDPAIVVLLGPRGAGKTWVSCGLIRAACDALISSKYTTAGNYFARLKDTFDGHGRAATVEAEYTQAGLLVLDEFQERQNSEWEGVQLTRLVDARYADCKATILIGNQTIKEFTKTAGSSIADRCRDDGGGVLECTWQSLRGRLEDRR